MRYKLLGRSGLRVSELCLGTMTFGEDWGIGASKEESRRIFDRFAEAGGNFIDTAHVYTNGTSETLVGEFIAADRGHFVVGTKYTPASRGDIVRGGNSRKAMMQSIEESLTRLRTDYVDIYWLHFWDFMTPVDEVMRGLDDLVSSGKVLYAAFCNVPAWIVSQAQTLAAWRGWAPLVAIQIEYSLVERTPERDLLPMARALDLAVAAWSLLAGGVLTGKYGGAGLPGPTRKQRDAIPPRSLAIADTVAKVAGEIGATPAQVALAWLRTRQAGPGIIPILGNRSLAQLEDNLGSLGVTLEAAHLATLDEATRIDPGFPHNLLRSDLVRRFHSAGKFDLIDNHRA